MGFCLNKALLTRRVDDEMIVYNSATGETHLLQPEHIQVYELVGSSMEEMAAQIYPDKAPAEGRALVRAILEQLLEKQLVLGDGSLISRRSFSKAIATVPAILSLVAALPAAADSLGLWDSAVDGMVGSNSVMVPNNSMSINYTVRGGSGGGGGGGGRAIDSSGGTIGGADGGFGAFGVEVSMNGVTVTAGSTLTVIVGGAGMGGRGGGDATVNTVPNPDIYTGGAGGVGGSGGGGGAPSGVTGQNGGEDTINTLGRGGGGGGGGRGGDSQIVSIAGALAAGGTGGGGGEGGMGSMNTVAGMLGVAGSNGNTGGAGGASGGTPTDGGNGGGNPTATPTANSVTGTGGAGSPPISNTTGGNGGDGEDGRVVIVFCP